MKISKEKARKIKEVIMAANICAELTDRLWCPLIPAGNAASLLTGVLAGL